GGGRAHLRRAAGDGGGGIGAALIGGDVGLVRNQADLVEADVQLLGGDLGQGGGGPLAELDEADGEGDGVVGVDGQPGVDLLQVGAGGRRRALREGANGGGVGEGDLQGAAGLQQ